MKKFVVFAFTAISAIGVSALTNTPKTVKAANATEDTSVAEYIPMTADNLCGGRDDDFRDINVNDFIRGANPSYWAENRSYGTPYPILDTFVDEWRVGALRTRDIALKGGTYISFLIGGNPHLNGEGHPASFINIWNGSRDVYSGIHNDAFNDPKCALNMTFKHFYIEEDGNYLLYIRDGANGGFGGLTFGELRINQTFDEVCESFSAHKAYYRSAVNDDVNVANSNAAANEYMLNFYNGENYRELNERIAQFTSGNEGFERNNGLLGWTVDRYSVREAGGGNVIGFTNANSVVDTADSKWDGPDGWFNVAMPFNKTGNGFFNGEGGFTGLGEPESWRFISHEFKLSSDLVSVKLGGGTAVLDVIDANTHEVLATTSRGGDHPNPAFSLGTGGEDSDHGRNLSRTGTRLNTMSRVYLDVHSLKGRQVRLAISDSRLGGNWGLAYFDEIITNYDVAPSFALETFTQTAGETTYHGVITPKYVGGNDTVFGAAYTFLNTYYETMRSRHNASWCSLLNSETLNNLLASYDALSTDAKAIVDTSEDYHHQEGVNVGNETNYWLLPVVKGTVGATIAYAKGYTATSISNLLFSNGLLSIEEDGGLGIVLVILCVSLGLLFVCLMKRRKTNN